MMAAAILAVLAGGFLGGVARFWLSGFVGMRVGELFPWGTLFVNVTGAALIGLLAGLAARGDGVLSGPLARDFLLTGFCGGYTTVSSFALQTVALGLDGERRSALFNIVVSTGLSMIAVAAGYLAPSALAP